MAVLAEPVCRVCAAVGDQINDNGDTDRGNGVLGGTDIRPSMESVLVHGTTGWVSRDVVPCPSHSDVTEAELSDGSKSEASRSNTNALRCISSDTTSLDRTTGV